MRIFAIGIFIGICDLIPGVSGGTIAYLLGIYPKILKAIDAIDRSFFRDLFLLKFKQIQTRVDLKFILPLGLGILCAVFTFCHVIRFVMSIPVGNAGLMGLFLGLVGCLSVEQLQEKSRFAGSATSFILFGFFGFYLFNMMIKIITGLFFTSMFSIPLWVFAGALCAIAMLLPGISGAVVLLLLGLYPALIDALCRVVDFHLPSLFILGSFFIGAVLGIMGIGKFLNRLFTTHLMETELFLSGFTLSAALSLLRFLLVFQGPLLWFSVGCAILGVVLGKGFMKMRYQLS